MDLDYSENIMKDFGIDSRRESLEKLRSNLAELGFRPLPLSINDLECYWVKVVGVDKPYVSISWELYEDALNINDLMDSLKKVCK